MKLVQDKGFHEITNIFVNLLPSQACGVEQAMRQWVKWVTFSDGSHGSKYCDPDPLLDYPGPAIVKQTR